MALDDLLRLIPEILDGIDIRAAVASRETEEMVSGYSTNYEALKKLKEENKEESEAFKNECEVFSNRAFRVADYVCGDGDLSAIIANDFELIYLADKFSYNDYWLNKLTEMYEEGIFPVEIL